LNRSDLVKALNAYDSSYEEEMKCKSRFLDLLSYDNCFERSLTFGHITASAWVLDVEHQKVLMLHHKKLDKWLQPGGHADGNEDVLAVARQELEEETGLKEVYLLDEEIFDLDIHHIPARKTDAEHEHYDVRFVFSTKYPESIVKNHESNDLKWVALADVAEYSQREPSVMRMVEKSRGF